MKKETKRLALKKETVSILDKVQKANALGGGAPGESGVGCRTRRCTNDMSCSQGVTCRACVCGYPGAD